MSTKGLFLTAVIVAIGLLIAWLQPSLSEQLELSSKTLSQPVNQQQIYTPREVRKLTRSRTTDTTQAKPRHGGPIDEGTKLLLGLRESDVRRIRLAQKLINTPSFSARAHIYCLARIGNQSMSVGLLSNLHYDEMMSLHAKLAAEEPTTREEEQKRQQMLWGLGQDIAQYEERVRECEAGVVEGIPKLPSNQEELQEIEEAERDIKSIDAQLANVNH